MGFRIKSKLFHDVLRDKGSLKYSITKFLSIVFSAFLIFYLGYTMFQGTEFDHAIVGELMALIGGLVGLKNNWGMKDNSKSKTSVGVRDEVIDSGTNDDAVF